MEIENIVNLLTSSIKSNWDLSALSDYQGQDNTFGDVGREILRIHKNLKTLDIQKGDKVALVGKNMANWGIAYLSVVTFGAVIVPILPDFKPKDLHYIIHHSDARILIIEESILKTLQTEALSQIECVFSLDTLDYLGNCSRNTANLQEFRSDQFKPINREDFPDLSIPLEELAVINYTSGTTGFSKGVMLSHKSVSANISFARKAMSLEPGDKIVSFLPLAHAFGCAFDFLYPFTMGCHITFLTKIPSPQIVMEAFKKIRPRLIFSVPLVIEKIYKNRILPVIKKDIMRFFIRIPLINQLILRSIRKKVYDVFGGNFRELVIGGAAFNHEAERFFKQLKLPFTVGYGMTECGPLISYSPWDQHKRESAGRIVDTLELKIDSNEPERIVGEILVRGDNLMQGYYKNKEATEKVIDKEGWLHTGDLGVTDKQKNIYIRGRSKNMILGPSGKNIYPEEIESLLNNLVYINESVVIDRKNTLVALVQVDQPKIKEDNISEEEASELIKKEIKELNGQLPGYMKIQDIEIRSEEFEKTPKKSIKRFLYK